MPLSFTLTGIQSGTPGYEIDLLYLACLTALVLGGTGRLSLDLLIRQPPSTGVEKHCGHDSALSGFCRTAKLGQLQFSIQQIRQF